ncbi:uncharacterized protein LOC135844504 [Planococcus citri]|uniref:uncharacterized protein LOC135844504 n=1 Tax=Planococcus citri TaxID=170843 RepID=UPI0031F80BBD
MAWCGTTISKDFEGQIADLENEISNRQVSVLEAQIYYEHLASIYQKVGAFESKIKSIHYYGNPHQLSTCLNILRMVYLRAIKLEIRLREILSSAECSTTPIKTMVFGRSSQAKESTTSEPVPVVPQLAEAAASAAALWWNLPANIDHKQTAKDGSAFIAEFSNESKTPQSKQTESPEPESTAVQQSLVLKLSELETRLQSHLDKLDEQAAEYGNGYDEYDRTETDYNTDEILISLDDNLDVSKEIQSTVSYLEGTLNKFADDNKQREKTILDKLNELLKANKSQNKDCKCKKIDPMPMVDLTQPSTRNSSTSSSSSGYFNSFLNQNFPPYLSYPTPAQFPIGSYDSSTKPIRK